MYPGPLFVALAQWLYILGYRCQRQTDVWGRRPFVHIAKPKSWDIGALSTEPAQCSEALGHQRRRQPRVQRLWSVAHHSSNTSSEQNPGPIASSIP
jgi:hypothetical protein